MTILSGFPRFGKRWPRDTKVIHTGIKGNAPASVKHEKHGRIIFCNLARRPYTYCHDCEDFNRCICRPRNFKRRPPYDSRD